MKGNTLETQHENKYPAYERTYPHKLLKNSSQLSIFNDNRLIMRENWRGLFLKEIQASNAQKSLKWLSRKNTQITLRVETKIGFTKQNKRLKDVLNHFHFRKKISHANIIFFVQEGRG